MASPGTVAPWPPPLLALWAGGGRSGLPARGAGRTLSSPRKAAAAQPRGGALGPQPAEEGSGPLRLPRASSSPPGGPTQGLGVPRGRRLRTGGAGWTALCPTAWPFARSGSRPVPAARRRRRSPQPRRSGGSRFSLPVSCTTSFLLVTKTCAAEHAQCSQPLAAPQLDPPLRIL